MLSPEVIQLQGADTLDELKRRIDEHYRLLRADVVNCWDLDDTAYANIHVHDAGAGAQTIPYSATVYTKLTGLVDDGEFKNCTPVGSDAKITINKTGRYLVTFSCSFTADTNSVVCYIAAFLNGVEIDPLHFVRKISTGGDIGSASFAGILEVDTPNHDLDVRMRHTVPGSGSIDFTMQYSNLIVVRIGDL